LSFNIIACCFELVLLMIVPRDLPVNYYATCVVFHSKCAFHYNTRFVITLISLPSQNERYNEVAVY